MGKRLRLFILLGILLSFNLSAQVSITGHITDVNGQNISDVEVFASLTGESVFTDENGGFIMDLPSSNQELILFKEGYFTLKHFIPEGETTYSCNLTLEEINVTTDVIEITAREKQKFASMKLRDVVGTAIYASKKTEVISLDQLNVNVATNNARQIFASVPGLNIWESDAAGIQLGIGARGLDPNRTANFNTRQDGYDISADALGYPESYYTPTSLALKSIEVVRGAASLQYGPQFGGLLNFKMNDGIGDYKFRGLANLSIGSYGLYNAFLSAGGNTEKLNYYAFVQKKISDGFRPNSSINQNTAYGHLGYKITPKAKINFYATHMDYVAQQAGGLVDFEFNENPKQSKRARNWFNVDWNLFATTLDYNPTKTIKTNFRVFHLNAKRQSIGDLGPINRQDRGLERDIIRGDYKNWGAEARLIKRYNIGKMPNNFLIGARYYKGNTENRQGFGSDGSDADFTFKNFKEPGKTSYVFPSSNVAIFSENLFNITDKWSITPGIRYEYISTNSDGYYYSRVFSGGKIIFEEKTADKKTNNRDFILLGLGSSYRIKDNMELYFNASQNYRSINFTDLAVVNPNIIVDENLQDERGFNIDLGARGQLSDFLHYDISAFYLKYSDRIGIGETIVEDAIRGTIAKAYRTNIGDANIIGLESYIEYRKKIGATTLKAFTNTSIIDGKYVNASPKVNGNRVELIPMINAKFGLGVNYNNFHIDYQIGHTSKQYTDATNADLVADATRGVVPAYTVQDISFKWSKKPFTIQANVNNIADVNYFTRRAVAYPGPGIIPAEKRTLSVSVQYVFEK